MTIVIASVAAPWGPIRVAAGARGVVALEQLVSEEEFRARLEGRFRARVATPAEVPGPDAADAGPAADDLAAAHHLAAAITALEAWLAGDLGALETLPLDLSDRPAWDRAVLGAVREIPAGSTASYGEVARMVGRPGAARAVGGAVGRNPIGLAIPCHRVIAGDGSLGGYGGGWWGGRETGLRVKGQLLAREGVRVRRAPASRPRPARARGRCTTD